MMQTPMTYFRRILKSVGHFLFDRVSLIIGSLLVLAVAAHVVRHLYDAASTPANDVDEMLLEVEGVSSLFLGIGLILKERRLLERIFGMQPADSEWLNDLCVNIGLSLILNGTAMRLLTQLIRIPDHVISTQGMERILFFIGMVFCFIAFLLLVCLIFRLSFRKPDTRHD